MAVETWPGAPSAYVPSECVWGAALAGRRLWSGVRGSASGVVCEGQQVWGLGCAVHTEYKLHKRRCWSRGGGIWCLVNLSIGKAPRRVSEQSHLLSQLVTKSFKSPPPRPTPNTR